MRTNAVRMSDAEIREEVMRELRGDSRLKGTKVDVAVSDGTATLSGTVADGSELLAAIESARRAEGVFEVVNELRVDPYAGKPRTDANLAAAVRQALEWDALIPHRRIQVAASNGWVALHGSVERQRDRANAERLARRHEGVRGVYNMIEVDAPSARAEDVRDRIEEALRRHARREADQIQVSLNEGTVNVSGRVHTWAEKQAVLGALRRAPGIERIKDELSVDPYY